MQKLRTIDLELLSQKSEAHSKVVGVVNEIVKYNVEFISRHPSHRSALDVLNLVSKLDILERNVLESAALAAERVLEKHGEELLTNDDSLTKIKNRDIILAVAEVVAKLNVLTLKC